MKRATKEKNNFKSFLKYMYRNAGVIIKGTLNKLFKRRILVRKIKQNNFYRIPIYIISYNRLNYLKNMLQWLEKDGYSNITIIDNCSTYEPLLEFYRTCKCKVIKLKRNYGHRVLEKKLRFWFAKTFTFYCLTDPDVFPISECPPNFVEYFFKVMKRYPQVSKVGFSLKIDDIPDEYNLKSSVIEWESQWYRSILEKNDTEILYAALLDTTFAICSPTIFVPAVKRFKAIRTGEPYQLRHLPWYKIEKDDEDLFYDKVKSGISHW